MKTLAFLVFIIAFNGMDGQNITGKVIGRKGEPVPFANVLVEDTLYHSIIGRAIVDFDGFYKISPLSPSYYYLISYDPGYPDKKFVVKITKDTVINIDLSVPCEYDKSEHDSTCPVCQKIDQVIPIVYGLLINSNGKDTTFKAAGCIIQYCHPHWYCKRDKKEF